MGFASAELQHGGWDQTPRSTCSPTSWVSGTSAISTTRSPGRGEGSARCAAREVAEEPGPDVPIDRVAFVLEVSRDEADQHVRSEGLPRPTGPMSPLSLKGSNFGLDS